MMVLTSKLEVDQSMQPCLLKNSSKSYITPTPKGWREAEKIKTDFDWCVDVLITIAGVYIYTLRPEIILVGHVVI